jgi:hypothetical protein
MDSYITEDVSQLHSIILKYFPTKLFLSHVPNISTKGGGKRLDLWEAGIPLILCHQILFLNLQSAMEMENSVYCFP